MTPFLSEVLWNTSIASLLAVLVGCLGQVSWFRRRPAAMQVLWVLVLAKFVTPALLSVPILPALNIEGFLPHSPVADQEALPVIDARGTGVGETVETIDATLPDLVPLSPPVRGERPLDNASHFILLLRFCNVDRSGRAARCSLSSLVEVGVATQCAFGAAARTGNAGMGISQLPEVRSVAALCAPFLWAGGRRACIYVPQTVIEALDDGALTGVLCHELVHHARRDAWSSLFAAIVAAVCWWNPLVWWARRQLRLTQELCCDARVLERGGRSRRVYAETLLTTLELVTSGVRLPSALASSWGDSASLRHRFQMIGDTSVVTRLSVGFAASTVLLVGRLLCVPIQATQVDTHLNAPASDAQVSDVDKNVKARTAKTETAPLFIHFVGNTQDNSSVHLLTCRVGPTGGLEDIEVPPPSPVSPLVVNPAPITRSVKELTGRLERRGEQYFADLEFHLPMRDGYFKGEVALDKPTFPVFLAATSVVHPVMFVVTQNPDPAPHLNQPFFKKDADQTTVVAEPPDVVRERAVRIVGRITDPAGKPLADMQIVAAVLPPPPKRAPKPGRRMEWKLAGEVPPSATSDEEGRFTIDKADARATIMLQFHGAELQQPRKWQPKGSLATTISWKAAEKESDLEVGYVPRSMTSKESTVDGRTTREVAIIWSPTKIMVHWGYAPTIEKWKEARTLAEARDPRWKDGLLATDETVWVVPPGQYMYHEHNQHLDLGSVLQLGTSWGQGLRADSEKEIILFFGALDPRTKLPANP